METVGDYEYNTRDLIGHGAFAVVFKGRHKQRFHSVAIKSIGKKNLQRSQSLLGKEIKILQELTELHHENVVSLLDCKETQHHVYLVMEYCNGGDLMDYLNSKGSLSEDTIRIFLKQIAGAMSALYAKGIVHRDLKPQNILLCHESAKSNPMPTEIKLKIADFGFARFLEEGVMANTLCGSPMYMAPEVIMSLNYDAKADLWSIATIVYQCLTGKAPFQASTPQALKAYYEKNPNLAPKIPSNTSADLTDLLLRLLRRNAKDRMEFDEFFNHAFLRTATHAMPVIQPSQRSSSVSSSPLQSPNSYGSSIAPLMAPHSPKVADEYPSTQSSSGSSDQVDDFVMVSADANDNPVVARTLSPKHHNKGVKRVFKPKGSPLATRHPLPEPMPVPSQKEAFEKIQRSCGSNNSTGSYGVTVGSESDVENMQCVSNNSMLTSPPLTPKPLHKQSSLQRQDSCSSMKSRLSSTGSGSRSRFVADISQLSPPTVHFVIGTPPGASSPILNGSRRLSVPITVGCQTPTPPMGRQASVTSPMLPAICAPPKSPHVLSNVSNTSPEHYNYYYQHQTQPSSWILRGSKTEPLIAKNLNTIGNSSGASKLSFASSSSRALTLNDLQHHGLGTYNYSGSGGEKLMIRNHPHNENTPPQQQTHPYHHCCVFPFGSGLSSPTHHSQQQQQQHEQYIFEAPELPEETLLDREHNETLAKLNFVLALVDCILELAATKTSPISMITKSLSKEMASESYRRAEQLVLYVRSLQLLSSALQLSQKEVQSGRLRTSASVRSILKTMKDRFHQCLNTCKSLDCNTLLNSTTQKSFDSISADKLIYNYAIEMCQTAALEELYGRSTECFNRYQTAQILLHSLSQQVYNEDDKRLLNKYKEAVEKRLYVLQSQGIVFAFDNSSI